ncbi:hypothetical protein MPTK1_4g16170 [Marchantia polymorpha subsp. ruderalis]|uniref:Uncharacterized protein n=2 Tax=Marchantia polymorpha TaxID=3197 RepID=A0AAF6BAF3_MARPO|nr:hypothetical protein MARPO_0054s0082 [Marchantia polymorpha]BBN08987.1 hypothetical protein Mp_4g16170 [Marchantia polymorpha subsp. ruderalis]|eukprot:PTQ37974.1 hypothetical protein MARPO_0054s0082 [Marchantia polymorpha]
MAVSPASHSESRTRHTDRRIQSNHVLLHEDPASADDDEETRPPSPLPWSSRYVLASGPIGASGLILPDAIESSTSVRPRPPDRSIDRPPCLPPVASPHAAMSELCRPAFCFSNCFAPISLSLSLSLSLARAYERRSSCLPTLGAWRYAVGKDSIESSRRWWIAVARDGP